MLKFISVFVISFIFMTPLSMANNGNGAFKNAMQYTYTHNPELQAARAELEALEELRPQAHAGWKPTVSLNGNIYSTDIESSNFSQGTGATTKDMTASIDQPLFRGGRTFAETARAKHLINAGKATLRQQEQDVLLDTVRVWASLARDEALLGLRSRYVDILRQDLEAARTRFEFGEITVTDTRQAETRFSKAMAERDKAYGRLMSTRAAYERVVGLSAPENIELPSIVSHAVRQLERLLAKAERKSPALEAAQMRKIAAEHNTDAIFRERLPQIYAYARYNKQYDPQPGITDETEVQTIGVRASLTLYGAGAILSRTREARKTEKQRSYEIDDIRRDVRANVTSGWQTLEAIEAQIRNTNDEIASSELALEGVRREADLGQRTILDVLDAQQEVLDAMERLVVLESDAFETQMALMADSGYVLADVMGLKKETQDMHGY